MMKVGTKMFAGMLTAVLLFGMLSIPATASEVAQTSLVADTGEDLTVNEGEVVYFNGSGSGGSSTTTYWDDFTFTCDSWITAAPSDATLAEFSYSSTTYPALVALEYGLGRSVYAEGSTFSQTKDSPDFVRYQLFINSVKWVTKDKAPSQTNILATWGHRELLTYHDGSNIITMLENQGYTVDISFDVPTSLTSYDAVVMPGIGWGYYYGGWVDPNLWSGYGGANPNGHAPTDTEVSTLLTFIQNGGGFVASVEEPDGANWLSDVGNPMDVSFAFISPAIPTGYRLVDHPIFYKWNDNSDTEIVSYEWDFDVSIDSDGDGDPTNDVDAMGATPTHLYGDDGVYTVTLTVTDTDDLTATDTMTVTVNNVASTVSISASPGTIGEGGSVTLTGYFDDPGWLDTHLAIWDFGDGTTEVGTFTSGIGFTHHDMTPMTHTYGDDGIYTVTLTVMDDDGATDTGTCIVTVIAPLTSAELNITKEKLNGPDVVEVHTCYGWTLGITVTNLGGSDATDVFVYDVLPAELALIDHTLTQGTLTIEQNGCGKMGSTSLKWNIETISSGEYAYLTLVISTITNPGGQQEFTSPGNYSLNDGAWVTYIDSLTGEGLSAGPTPPITVVAVDPEDDDGCDDTDDECGDDAEEQVEEPEGEENEEEMVGTSTSEAETSPLVQDSPSEPTKTESSAREYMENKAKQPNRWFGTYTQILLLFAVVVIGIALEIAKLRTEKQRDKIIEELDRKLIKGEMSEESYLKEVEKVNN